MQYSLLWCNILVTENQLTSACDKILWYIFATNQSSNVFCIYIFKLSTSTLHYRMPVAVGYMLVYARLGKSLFECEWIYLHFPMFLFVITLRIKFVTYSPIHFINDGNDILLCVSGVCIILRYENNVERSIIWFFNEQLVKVI